MSKPLRPLEDRGASVLAFLASFGSIAAMLGHVSAIAPFWTLGWSVVLPCTALLVGLYLRAVRNGQTALAQALRVGFWGGLWGTLGYDLVRIPLHLVGMNPFAPIRSYGMYLANADHSWLLTDWLGALYHVSNGVGFGIAYTLVMRGRSLWWGVLWGLVLEVLAVVTPYGEAYQIRYAPTILAIGFFAHVYYGLPLGGAAASPDETDRWTHGPGAWPGKLATVLGVVAVLAFLGLAWEGAGGPNERGLLTVGPDALRNGWTRVQVGEPLAFQGRGPETERVRLPALGIELDVAPGDRREVVLDEPGIYQVIAVGHDDWRSVFVSVEDGPYPRRP